jgi:hypothetical protein
LEAVNAEGIPARTFTVMSGYRTPYYNTALNNVRYSRHMWGDAADIYINNDSRNDVMDDLNGDGKRDAKDAEMLYDIVDELKDNPAFNVPSEPEDRYGFSVPQEFRPAMRAQ